MLRKRDPEDVFTPNAVATQDMFERRNEPDRFGNPGLQDRVIESLRQKGAQLRVYGDAGVGKTSLVTFAAMDAGRKALVVECRSSHDYGDLLEQAIRSIQGVKLTSYVKKREVAGEVGATGGWKFLATITGKVSTKAGQDRSFEVVDKAPLDLLIELMLEQGYRILVLDNFQNVTDVATRLEVAQTLEVMSDRANATEGLKVVVIGIAEDAHSLLTPSASVRRRTVDIGVPRMPDEEIAGILEAGFGLLHMDIEESLLDHLVYYSDGFPYFTHMIGLNISRAARRDGADRIRGMHVAAGLLRTVNEVDETYSSRVRMASERAGDVQPKKHLLRLLAQSTDRTWTASDAKVLWSAAFGGDVQKLAFVDVAMGSLIKAENGSVLVRDESSSPYRYRFSDPHFRAFLRLQAELGEGAQQQEALAASSPPELPPVKRGEIS